MNQYSESKEIREKEQKKKWREKEKRKDELRAKISGRKEHGLQGGQLFYFLFIYYFFLRCFPVTRVTDWAKKDRLLVVLSRESEGF